MFALKPRRRETVGTGALLSRLFAAMDGMVLPRWLRRPARFLARLNGGEIAIPPFAMTMASAVLLASSGLYGAYVGGHMPAVVQTVTAHSGFAVDEVRILGYRETSEIDVLDRLELNGWTSLIGFSAEEARKRVSELPWVKTVAVQKIYPDAIEVRIEERKPFALWQHGNDLSIIEENGNVIVPFSDVRHASLPLVIGLGAAERAKDFIARIGAHPEIASRVKAYIRMGDRRWDLRLDNGVTVKLPEKGEMEAVEELLALDRENGVLGRDIVAIDMRLPDRLAIQLTPDAAVSRNTAITERMKAAKKAGRSI